MSRRIGAKTKVRLAAFILLSLMLLFVIGGVYIYKFGLIPGPEGVRALSVGYQFGSADNVRMAGSLDALPSGYQWGRTDPLTMALDHVKSSGQPSGGYFMNGPGWWYDHGGGEILTEVQRPMLTSDPIGVGTQQLTYYKYTKVSDTQVQINKIMVCIIPADFVIQISAVPGKGIYTFKGITEWFSLDSVSWLNAYSTMPPQDPNPLTNDTTKFVSSNYRGAFPIIAWIGKYEDTLYTTDAGSKNTAPPDQNAQQYVQLQPDLAGRFISLYTSASSTYDLGLQSNVVQDPNLLAQALSPDTVNWMLPDPRFSQTVYFSITMSSFGAYVQQTGQVGTYSSYTEWYPSVYYRLRVVYALAGDWVYLWTAKTAADVGYTPDTWTIRNGTVLVYKDPLTALLENVGGWLSNPFNQLWVLFIILVAVVLVVTILNPGLWMALLSSRKSSKTGKT